MHGRHSAQSFIKDNKTSKILRMLSSVDRCVYMRVCKRGDVLDSCSEVGHMKLYLFFPTLIRIDGCHWHSKILASKPASDHETDITGTDTDPTR